MVHKMLRFTMRVFLNKCLKSRGENILLREKISLHFVDIDRLKLTCVLNRLKVYDTLSWLTTQSYCFNVSMYAFLRLLAR